MNTKALEIDILAVGDKSKSGDSILIRYGNLEIGHDKQSVILIDGGFGDTAEDIKKTLRDYYKCKNRNGKFVIDLVILTHPDLDHVAGLAKLADDDEIEILNVLMHKPWDVVDIEDFKDKRKTQRSLEESVKESFSKAYTLFELTKHCQVEEIWPGRYTLDGAVIIILGPSEETYKDLITNCDKTPQCKDLTEQTVCCSVTRNDDDEERYIPGQTIKWDYNETTSMINETSFIILFEYNGHRLLFTGDAGKDGLREAIEYAEEIGVSLDNLDLIKMPHHGSRKNVDPELMDEFLQGNKTPWCYISCVKDDVGHHPSKRLVNMLNQKGFDVYTTSGTNQYIGFGAPPRTGYVKAIPLDDYNNMEKL